MTKDGPPLLLHVGYHKTATTWMQRQLFQPVHGYRQLAGHIEVFETILRPHDLVFDPEPAQAMLTEAAKDLLPGEVPVVSSEILSGLPFEGGRESASYAGRLARIAPGARILLTIRTQLKILPSVYMQYVRRGGTLPPERFFGEEPGLGYFGFDPVHFEYDRLTRRYQSLFGAENVYIFPQEALRSDRDAALAALARFAGNELYDGLAAPVAERSENASDPEYAVPLLRRLNHFRSEVLNRNPVVSLGPLGALTFRGVGYLSRRPLLARLWGNRRPVTLHVAKTFAGRFEASNAQLKALLAHHVDLSAYPSG